MESFVASLTLARDLLMHHRQPETKEKHSILVGEASWKRYIHSGMCCCQPYTRERTSHAPQTSGKRKSENERGLSHEVPPPTQRPVLKCLGRTVRPYSTVSFLTLEEPATGTRASEEGACPMKSHLRHSARYSSVLREPFDHAPLPLSKSMPLGRCASNERLSHEVSSPTQR